MTENKIKEIMLDIGKNARMASHSVSTLDEKTKNDILFDASENLMKNKKKILDANSVDIEKNKSKLRIGYRVSGEAFLTKPNETTFMIKNIIKKITKINPKLSTTGGTSDLRFIKSISPGLEFGLVGKTMHKVDEAVSLKDLKNLTKIYQNNLQSYFK